MSPRVTIAAGLVSGALVAVIALAIAVAFLPEPAPGVAGSAEPSASVPAIGGSGSPGSSDGSPGPTVVASVGEALFHVGEPAPPLRVPQVGGGEVDLANLDGRPVWVNFMQTTCPPCIDEFPLMNGFAARYAEAGLVIVAIDIREEEGVVAAFAQGLNAAFPIGLDADGSAAEAWDASAVPVHFWIDRDGVIRAGALGGIGPDLMAENLATILPGVDVTP